LVRHDFRTREKEKLEVDLGVVASLVQTSDVVEVGADSRLQRLGVCWLDRVRLTAGLKPPAARAGEAGSDIDRYADARSSPAARVSDARIRRSAAFALPVSSTQSLLLQRSRTGTVDAGLGRAMRPRDPASVRERSGCRVGDLRRRR
jgi:hypothetical protein